MSEGDARPIVGKLLMARIKQGVKILKFFNCRKLTMNENKTCMYHILQAYLAYSVLVFSLDRF